MEKKQTAVEWLVDQMFRQGYFNEYNLFLIEEIHGDGNTPLSITNLDHLQHQAMEMEKQSIIDAWDDGALSDPLPTHNNALHYYEKTYGK